MNAYFILLHTVLYVSNLIDLTDPSESMFLSLYCGLGKRVVLCSVIHCDSEVFMSFVICVSSTGAILPLIV